MKVPNMMVAVRVRPLSETEANNGQKICCTVVGDQVVTIEKSAQPGRVLRSQQASSNEYAFDVAFDEKASQQCVYESTVKSVIPTILDGYNATVFAYGATGAGKTYTMMGVDEGCDGKSEFVADGIVPQALEDIFSLIQEQRQQNLMEREKDGILCEWSVKVSYLEVYNEQIKDLLVPSSSVLALREDPGVVMVAGLQEMAVETTVEVMELLKRGNENRKTESTAANSVSSRSHAVLQVLIRQTKTQVGLQTNPQESCTEGKLSLIDLAGSERASNTKNRGIRLTEGANINKSLLALANCINALASHTQKRTINRRQSDVFSSTSAKGKANLRNKITATKVQYRDSKLTHLLKSSLEGDCRLVMIANINPSSHYFEESHNTLKYANRAKNIKVRPKMQVVTAELSYKQRSDKLQVENQELRSIIASLGSGVKQMVFTPTKQHPSPSPTSTPPVGLVAELQHANMTLQKENATLLSKVCQLEFELAKYQNTPSTQPKSRQRSVSVLARVDENVEPPTTPSRRSRRNSLIPKPPSLRQARTPKRKNAPIKKVSTPQSVKKRRQSKA